MSASGIHTYTGLLKLLMRDGDASQHVLSMARVNAAVEQHDMPAVVLHQEFVFHLVSLI